MTWLAAERDVAMMETKIEYKVRSRNDDLRNVVLPLPSMVTIANEALQIRDLVKKYHAGRARIYLRDSCKITEKGKDFVVFLLAISDKRRPDHVLSDPDIGGRREVFKENNEGTECSCHVVICLEPILDGGARYRTAIEVVPHFSFTYVRRYVRQLFKNVSVNNSHEVDHPAGVKKGNKFVKVPVLANTEMESVPSEQLLRDIERGVLAQIELSKEVQGVKGFDEEAYTIDKRYKLLLGLTQAQEGVPPMQVIKSVCKAAEEKKFPIAKVTWSYDGGNKKASAAFDCDTATPVESKYIRRSTFVLDHQLPASCEEISEVLARKMAQWIS